MINNLDARGKEEHQHESTKEKACDQ